MLLKIKAAAHGVAPKLIADKDDIQAIAMGEDLDTIPALKAWRAEVFGNDALALLAGEITLGFQDGKIAYFKS